MGCFCKVGKGTTVKYYKVKKGGLQVPTNKAGKFSDAFTVASTSISMFIARDSTPFTGLEGRNAGVNERISTGRCKPAGYLQT